MSEPLFAALLLGALAAAIQHRRSTHRWRWVLLAGFLGGPDDPHARQRAGAAAAARARGLDGPAALLAARARRPGGARRARAAHGLAVDDPQRDRLRPLHPGQHAARLGARRHLQRPGARSTRRTRRRGARSGTCRSTGRCTRAWARSPSRWSRTSLRKRSKAYIREHPGYVGKVALWTTLRMFELGGLDWSRHTASTISVGPRWANAGVDLLLDLRAARARRRVHEARAADAVLRLADPDPALPERGLPGGRDPALPHGDRPVHRHARGAGATTSTSRRRGP